VTYSHTQIREYLNCPRRYRYHYLEGWQEKEDSTAALFGRAFEEALAANFLGTEAGAVLQTQWDRCRDHVIRYDSNKKWKEMLQQGIELLACFQQHNRLRVPQPQRNLNIKVVKRLSADNDFIGYLDAIGYLDGSRSILEWKTTSSRYPDEPVGLLALDPQLVCYSWLTGIARVSLICFVRKRAPEIQYLSAVISEVQRNDYGRLVENTVAQIEAANFSAHSGIRFPHSACLGCPFIGLCLQNPQLIAARLKRRPGAEELDWINELAAQRTAGSAHIQ
jgi:hypothetical protein